MIDLVQQERGGLLAKMHPYLRLRERGGNWAEPTYPTYILDFYGPSDYVIPSEWSGVIN